MNNHHYDKHPNNSSAGSRIRCNNYRNNSVSAVSAIQEKTHKKNKIMNSYENENTNNRKPMAYNALLGTVDFKQRVKDKPYYTSFHNGQFVDSVMDEGKIDYAGLNDHQKLCLYVYAWNTSDILPGKKGILERFGWTNYKLQKLIKELKGAITTEPTFSEHTGLLNGRGYFYCAYNTCI